MEHRLILGAGHYLPFARSRIRALRAAGLNHAAQKFTLPDGQVSVQITPTDDFIRLEGGGGPLWVLVRLRERTVFGITTAQHTWLYRLPLSLKAEHAKRVYKGSTAKTVTFEYDTAPSGVEQFPYVSAIVDFDTDIAGALGAISGAAPHGNDVLLWANRWTKQYQEISSDGFFNQEQHAQVRLTTKLAWKGQAQTYTYGMDEDYKKVSGAVVTPFTRTHTGDLLANAPRFLAPGLACFKVQHMVDSTTSFKAVEFGDEPSIIDDDAGIDPILDLVEREEPYTRREVGSALQGPNFIYRHIEFEGSRRYARNFAYQDAAASPISTFYTRDRVIVPVTDGPSEFCFAVQDFNGDELAKIDLGKIKALAEDPLIAQFLGDRSAWAWAPWEGFAPTTENFSETSVYPWTVGLNGYFYSGYPAASAATMLLTVQFLPDQAGDWPQSEET